MQITSFNKIAKKYKAIFFDSFGVLKNYKGIIDGAQDTFNTLIDNGIDYFIITNDASRSPHLLSENYTELGYHNIPPERIISSGMMACNYLKSRFSKGKIAYLGTEAAAAFIQDYGLDTIHIENVSFENDDLDQIKAIVLLDDDGYDWKIAINNIINLLRLRNTPLIVANTDELYPISKHEVAVAVGGISQLIEKVTGKYFVKFGKPNIQIFNYAFDFVNANNGYIKDEILMVGDTLTTDIIGANRFGIDSALVLSGNTIPDHFEYLIESTGIIPTYICESICS